MLDLHYLCMYCTHLYYLYMYSTSHCIILYMLHLHALSLHVLYILYYLYMYRTHSTSHCIILYSVCKWIICKYMYNVHVLYRSFTGENWERIMLSCVNASCHEEINSTSCGSPASYVFFPVFFFIASILVSIESTVLISIHK